MKKKPKEKKSVKAWAIFDKETGALARYYENNGEYMIGPVKTPRRKLHETFEPIICTITYEK